ncbi:MAG: carboxymuconolactone decarboxylase family protein [Pseudomonadota bacterium]
MTASHTRTLETEIPDILQAMSRVHGAIGRYGFDRMLEHLVFLRVSQINKCSYCVKMHTEEARADGETNERLDRLIVWRHVEEFSDRERAAFAWAEALTELDRRTDIAALRETVRAQFSETELGVLTSLVAMINLWNRVQISQD